MSVSGEVGTAVGVIIVLVAINILLLSLNFLRKSKPPRVLWISNDGVTHRPTSFWAFECLDAQHLVKGCLWPWSLFALQILQFLVFVFVIFWQAFGPEVHVYRLTPQWLIYFSNWTFMGFGLQALLGAYLAAMEMLRQILKEGTRNEPLQAPQSVSSGIASGRALQAPQYVSSDTATGRALQAPRSVSGDTASVRALAPPAGPIGLQQRQQQQQCQEGGPSHSRQEHDPEKGGGVLNREESEGKQEQREEPGAEPVLELAGRPYALLDKLYLLLFQTFFCASIVATIFYWSSEFSSGEPVLADALLRHGAHSFLMILDLLLSRIPVVAYHLTIVTLYHSTYAIFMFIYSIESWVYERLAWEYQLAPVFYAILVIMIFFSFGLMYLMAFLRERLLFSLKRRKEGVAS